MIEYKVRVYSDRTEWLNHKNQLHREDGPAIEYSNGTKYWFLNGKLHREDGPAAEYTDGRKCWFLNGIQYSEKEYWEKVNSSQSSCNGKVVEIDGKKYKLMEV